MMLHEMIERAALAIGPSTVPRSEVSPAGIDPLGLRQINFGLMDQVLPNLNNVASRLRPFVVLAWAWRRVEQIIHGSAQGGETDERLRDFVDRVEAIYSWSQFLIDPASDLPGKEALLPLIASKSYRFGGDAWVAIRNVRRLSTGLISPLNYGPGLRLMRWVEPVGHAGVFRANPVLTQALDAFEDSIRIELDHPAFSIIGEVEVLAEDVRRWGKLWSLDGVSEAERECGFDRLAGDGAPLERRQGLGLVCAAHASIGAETTTAAVRRRMADPVDEWSDEPDFSSPGARWRRVQVRQVFRLALEGLLFWIIGELERGPLDSVALAREFLTQVGEEQAGWRAVTSGLPAFAAAHPVDHLDRLRESLASRHNVPRVITEALRFCILEAPERSEAFERADRLPLTRAAEQWRRWAELPPEDFIVKVIEVWVLAQHAYWCVGRGLADARGRGKKLLRLKVVMDEGGWTLTPGTRQGNPPIATRDRLDSALKLMADCGRLSR